MGAKKIEQEIGPHCGAQCGDILSHECAILRSNHANCEDVYKWLVFVVVGKIGPREKTEALTSARCLHWIMEASLECGAPSEQKSVTPSSIMNLLLQEMTAKLKDASRMRPRVSKNRIHLQRVLSVLRGAVIKDVQQLRAHMIRYRYDHLTQERSNSLRTHEHKRRCNIREHTGGEVMAWL